ncbi:MAG: bifunctional 5,10-methylenetetrahydrofolate dehydrogenase/5,10-methenyltetrahydrofolate cyclohydrolase [Candidatus Magasanikbacteria bacterium]|jgi:methylenetetrahydrofolate dehydrogenase (NADP+) / methenyltetrahydrofolate cyclohydrolase|nr:bifunctional 5,10-methylenetetrahydrofolate dehydrogenase/5,10-methenyltetrahydrofolate cyclohydrolase [Candidatus Magasanikbacteria bacterium]
MKEKLILGKPIAERILADVKDRVQALSARQKKVKLAVVLVGDNAPSHTYVKKKGEAAKNVGIEFDLHHLPANISKEDIVADIKKLQADPELCGLIVQLPLPEPLYTPEVLNAIDPSIDVDCLTHVNLGKLTMNSQTITPPTPGAVMSAIDSVDVELKGKNVTIVGVGALVGKPLAIMMINKRASVTTCNSITQNFEDKCLAADVLVTGVGKKDLIRKDMIKPGAVVIDTGICFEGKKMYGDVNVEEAMDVAAHVTPTPRGIGPITVARLLLNTVICAEAKYK